MLTQHWPIRRIVSTVLGIVKYDGNYILIVQLWAGGVEVGAVRYNWLKSTFFGWIARNTCIHSEIDFDYFPITYTTQQWRACILKYRRQNCDKHFNNKEV